MRGVVAAICVLTAACASPAERTPVESAGVEPSAWQQANFGPLVELVGKTFVGRTPGEDQSGGDVQRWDWALGGAGLSISHALSDGSYGGETLVYRDGETDALVYVYVTNAGFRTEGSFDIGADGSWTAEEAVTGHPSITLVRSTGRMREDGVLVSSSQYLDNGEWVDGHTFEYREAAEGVQPTLDPPGG